MELDTMQNFLELMTLSLASIIRKINRKGVELNNYKLFFKNYINHTCNNHIDLHLCEKKDERIMLPTSLGKQVVEWYHINLQHPGINRTLATITHQFVCKRLDNIVRDIIKKCEG